LHLASHQVGNRLTTKHSMLHGHLRLELVLSRWPCTRPVTSCMLQLTPWLLVRKRTIQTEQPPLVGEVSANFCR
jgi:hypothetical protein